MLCVSRNQLSACEPYTLIPRYRHKMSLFAFLPCFFPGPSLVRPFVSLFTATPEHVVSCEHVSCEIRLPKKKRKKKQSKLHSADKSWPTRRNGETEQPKSAAHMVLICSKCVASGILFRSYRRPTSNGRRWTFYTMQHASQWRDAGTDTMSSRAIVIPINTRCVFVCLCSCAQCRVIETFNVSEANKSRAHWGRKKLELFWPPRNQMETIKIVPFLDKTDCCFGLTGFFIYYSCSCL